MHISIKISLEVLLVMSLGACVSEPVEFPTGEYLDADGFITGFLDDGRFTLATSSGELIIENGTYSIEGNILSVIDHGFLCGDKEGVYEWSVDREGVLQFEEIDEECRNRRQAFLRGMTPVR